MTIRAVIVDDERPAREKIRRYLASEADVEIVGEAADGPAAADAIERLSPDLVFLDVVMPGMDGFELLRQLPHDTLPDIVFVTAHDDHAIRAYDVNAVDYLLKPIDRDRFRLTLDRIRERRRESRASARSAGDRIARTLAAVAPTTPKLERLIVPSAAPSGGTTNRMRLLDVARIDWGETAGNYTALHAGAETHLVRHAMSRLLERLDPERFARVHRTRFVNIESVRELEPLSHGDLRIVLHTGAELTLNRRFRTVFWDRLKVRA